MENAPAPDLLHSIKSVHSPSISSKRRRRRSDSYDITESMHRLRSTMMGGPDPQTSSKKTRLNNFLGQVPAVALIGMFHLMIGIPFGVSYFPVSWSPLLEEASDDGGPFPLPGKEALGIRMFLFSTIVGQIVFTIFSDFPNPIGLQMVENVPFCHELANIVIAHQGYGIDALSTLIVMFGLASVVVGIVFFVLGKLQLGRVVYFFPNHVLVGCIGGIGVFIAKTGLEVTINDAFSIDAITSKWNLLAVIFLFEVVLRILERITKDDHGKPKYTLLSPIYFCMITPVFYFMLFILRVPVSAAEDAGYFFPSLDSDVSVACQGIDCSTGASPSFWDSVVHDGGMWDMWTIINIPTVSWLAVWDSIPTLLALSIFSLIHVPINIPAFALSTNTEADMNNELIAHGYSNMISGLVGGLQNYMAYTQSALYDKSGGTGKQSGAAVALVTSLLFFIGPTIASFIPRCMAGTLLLHVGLDLFLEGVFDSFSKFDRLEYAGIWLIVAVMTMYGMDAAMIAGGIAAVSTYAVQSIAYLSPIRGSMSAVTLRSSNGNRSLQAEAILDSPAVGRSRILVVQLQGHLFFGTVANFTESMYDILRNKIDVQDKNRTKDILDPGADVNASPIVVILDFSLVLGIDSSAAQAIAKLRRAMQKKYSVELCIFVAGSNEGFPTDFDLTKELSASTAVRAQAKPRAQTDVDPLYSENFDEEASEKTGLLLKTIHGDNGKEMLARYAGSHVCESLDRALIYAENALIAKEDPTLLDSDDNSDKLDVITEEPSTTDFSLSEEREIALRSLSNLCPVSIPAQDLELLFSILSREVYHSGEFIWKQHSASNCAKLLVAGTLTALIENEAGTTETILKGNMIGELGLIQGGTRMSSVQCTSSYVIVYSLSRESFENLALKSPAVARYVDLICIKYLNLRVQHVSNRIFETRCLPI